MLFEANPFSSELGDSKLAAFIREQSNFSARDYLSR